MQAPPGREDDGRQGRAWRLSRRSFVARSVGLGCSASAVAGLLAACTRTAPTAPGAPPIPTVTSAGRAPGTVVPPTTRAADSSPIATTTAGTVGTPAAATMATPTRTVAVEPLPASGLAWLRRRAIPFATAEPGGDAADLAPFTRLVGDARLVALGEATHGTHEFFAMKHRLVAFLVRELGFTGFAIEANGPEAERIDDYVQTGQGDPASLLAGLHYWTWNTREVLDLIGWMREYNAQRGSAVAPQGTVVESWG